MRDLIHQLISCILVPTFMLSGLIKISPALSAEIHTTISDVFHSFALVHPLLELGLPWDTSAEVYAILIGTTEVTCSVLLVGGSREGVVLSYYVLCGVMILAVCTHMTLAHSWIQLSAPCVFLLLILCQIRSIR